MSDKPSLEMAMAGLSRSFGETSVRVFSDMPETWPSISTGALTIDQALGIGGFPRGRISEVYGPESSGKTSLTLGVIAQAQKAGETVLFVDAEHALDPSWARKLGVNIDDLLISQPSYGEQGCEIVERMARTGELGLIVVDSVAALTPKAEIEGTMEDMQMGALARMMSKHMRKITAVAAETNTAIIYINQVREKMSPYGNPITTPGGRALKFMSSVRVELKTAEKLKDAKNNISGVKVKANVVKNKLATPYKTAEYEISYEYGMDVTSTVLDTAVELGIIDRSGANYSINDEKLGYGRANVVAMLRENEEMLKELVNSIEDVLHGTD